MLPLQSPDALQLVAFCDAQLIVTDCPEVIEEAEALISTLGTAGGGTEFTVIETESLTVFPLPVHVIVYVPDFAGEIF